MEKRLQQKSSYTVSPYPKMSAEMKFDISFNSHIIRICCGKANGEKPQEYKSPHVHLISAFKLYVPLHDKRVTIKFSPRNCLDCFCYCHHPVRTVFPTLYGSLRAFTSTGSQRSNHTFLLHMCKLLALPLGTKLSTPSLTIRTLANPDSHFNDIHGYWCILKGNQTVTAISKQTNLTNLVPSQLDSSHNHKNCNYL